MDNTPYQEPAQLSEQTYERARERRNSSAFSSYLSRLPIHKLGQLGKILQPLYHNIPTIERIELLLLVSIIISTFFPWVSLKDVVITGWNSFLYPFAFFITISSLLYIGYILWRGLGNVDWKWIPEKSTLTLFIGGEITQLGIILYILLHRYGITFSATTIHDITIAPLFHIVGGLALISIGLYGKISIKQKKQNTIVHPTQLNTHEQEEDHLSRILEQRAQDNEQHS